MGKEVTKITRWQLLLFHIKIIKGKMRAAIHRPFMIKAILTTRCPQCGHLFRFPRIYRQNTAYVNEDDNYFCGCKVCQKENERYWDEMWKQIY